MSATTLDQQAVTLADLTAFVWREADMLDRLDYKAWLRLWSEDGLYIVPVERGAIDHANAVNVLYDDAEMREMRVKRLLSGFSMSSAPPARTVRTVSRIVETARSADAVDLRAAQILVEYKYERHRMLAADVDYRIAITAGGLKLARKVVTLVNCDDALHGIGYLL
ncbi:aromatic-ring-hydroxylating dioxygenase, beta subunit (plasmid) [Novosphingobium aromaticivorans DSM 12444]|uniref:Aromatic-ring-hydroxylating dioxygenase, beta subunit n=1 Tax=Novosphingobium aromaticivorans (strain ATCC 700278 / DSM 12444 / CCUG 56034 / CIP 105152 / NBRC 16084 / F199) TaxID=279238 RepID=A4XFG1_NOVAD|nr:aromatic-ring-hydroxylating dioxygenase subunit beta [Novosphingobium aromaticivorans]ABP64672.1 aromatic-ring-hydroxylating dioxygenase, beta subunit [Novosphingobium aromaticivorans DSM 12444]SCY80304.1 3-phenylpropionate/cinnamic acid dioxygenase, small subunit [Novosphingobium aromaticivorans]